MHGWRLARELGVSYYECSAAGGYQVEDAFHHVIRETLAVRAKAKKIQDDDDDEQNDNRDDDKNNGNKKDDNDDNPKTSSLSTKISRRKNMIFKAIKREKNAADGKQIEKRITSSSSSSSSSLGLSKYGSIIKLHRADRRKQKCC